MRQSNGSGLVNLNMAFAGGLCHRRSRPRPAISPALVSRPGGPPSRASEAAGDRRARAGTHGDRIRWRDASIPIMLRLVRSLGRNADIGRLLVRHPGQLGADLGEMEPRDLLVEALGEGIDLLLVLLRIGPELDLRQRLVGE